MNSLLPTVSGIMIFASMLILSTEGGSLSNNLNTLDVKKADHSARSVGIFSTGMQISGLTCEYLTDPLGIDVTTPRLSWKLSDPNNTRGQKQTAYQILVASSLATLDSDNGDLWNTGQVSSPQSTLVSYNGSALTSGMDCYWKVRAWDKDGQASSWSPNGHFTMGLLNSSDWKGVGIVCTGVDNTPWYRKTFTLNNSATSAYASVLTTTMNELYVNGVKVGDNVLTPALTQPGRVLYVTYDITSYLTTGTNVIAIWTASKTPFKCQVNIKTNTTGNVVEVHSDTSWKSHPSSLVNAGAHTEIIDARKDIPNWNAASYDDSAWTNVVESGIGGTVSAQMIEPDRKIETVSPRGISGSNPYIVDMGKNYTGWFKINLNSGTSGQTVHFDFADRRTQTATAGQTSKYIYSGSTGTFCNRFNYNAGRYVTISNLTYKPNLSDITGYKITTDMTRTGNFLCSKPLFNEIYNTDIATYQANVIQGVVMDCPHFERRGYGEVGGMCAWGIGLTSFDAGAFYTHTIRTWKDTQQDSGSISTVAPGGTGFVPLWSSCPLVQSWEMYRTYGDTRVLSNNYTMITKLLNYMNSLVVSNLLNCGGWADWYAPGPRIESGDTALFFQNCVYAYDLDMGVKIATVLGNTGDSNTYASRLSTLRTNIHNKWYNADNRNYIDNHQLHNGFPLYTKVVPENLIAGVYANFTNTLNTNAYFDAGSSGLPMLLHYLIEGTDGDNSDLVYNCLSRTSYPSYGYFLNEGETCWPEQWEVDCRSKIHTCYTGITSWFMKGIGGIQSDPANYGFKDVIIKPAVGGGLTWANTDYKSMYGQIENHWTRSGSTLTLDIKIPVNSTARLYIPTSDTNGVNEGGGPASSAAGVQYLGAENGCAVYRVQSGVYSFQTTSFPGPIPTPTPAPGDYNLAKNEYMTATSWQGSYPPLLANDGKTATFWVSQDRPETTTQYLTCELMRNCNVNKVIIKPKTHSLLTYGPKDVAVEVSTDGTSYTQVTSSTLSNTAGPSSLTFTKASARYVRLKITTSYSPTNTQVEEFEIWGIPLTGVTKTGSALSLK